MITFAVESLIDILEESPVSFELSPDDGSFISILSPSNFISAIPNTFESGAINSLWIESLLNKVLSVIGAL